MATASSSRKQERSPDRKGSKRPKTVVHVACLECRRRKARCDGIRPVCENCRLKRIACIYETHEGETHGMAMRRQRNELQARLAQVEAQQHPDQPESPVTTLFVTPTAERSDPNLSRGAQPPSNDLHASLFNAMATASDRDAAMLLAKLRTGHTWQEIASELQAREGGIAEQAPVPPHEPLWSPAKSSTVATDDVVDDLRAVRRESSLPQLFSRTDWHKLHTLSLAEGSRAFSELEGHLYVSSSYTKSLSDKLPLSFHGASDGRADHTDRVRVPIWAVLPLTDDGAVNEPFQTAFQISRAEVHMSGLPDTFCGTHLWLEALYDSDTYGRAPRLSQVIADIARSIRPDPWADTLTTYAIMWLHWTYFRWILNPCPQTYDELPPLMRPIPLQMFIPHPFVLDIIIFPNLRSYLLETRKYDSAWFTPAVDTLVCDWRGTVEEATTRNEITGELELSTRCKASIARLEAWSLGKEVREVFPEIGQFAAVREE